MSIEWKLLHPRVTMAHLGLLPAFLSEGSPDPAAKQLGRGYSYGGGWSPVRGFRLRDDNHLLYPGDPPLRPIAETKVNDEVVCVYEHSFVAVIQPDRSFEVARMD